VLDPLREAGAVPTIGALLEEGAAGPLTSQLPPWTPSAWPSIYTGTNPGKHGVFDFLAFEGYDWEVVDATHVRERPLWHLLDAQGYSSVVVNVPVTAPPAAFDGALVPGYVAPERPPCHPEGLLDDLVADLGEYRVYPDADTEGAERLDDFCRLAEMRGKAFRYLADRFDPDFGFVQFQVTDTVCHERPGDQEALQAVYGAVDDAIAGMIDATDPDTVVLVSDHGIGPFEDYEFRINEFLADEGVAETTRGGRGMPSWATTLESQLREGRDGDHEPGVAERAMRLASRVGLTTQRVAPVVRALGLAGLARRFVSSGAVRAGERQVDFPASRAYMRSRSELGVRLNLAGREPEGVVDPDDYERVREDLIDRLADVRTPDGDPVFETVAPRETVFDGPELHRAPDVVTVPAGFEQFVTARLGDGAFGEPSEPWEHKRDGIVAVHGGGVDATELDGAHLFDVAPTVLASLGVPRDERMDGRVLDCLPDPGARAYPAYEPGERTATDDPAVENRLTNLGYLE
jgi:predicted AlkP superfamily phosphohydrolase/phosphomutase